MALRFIDSFDHYAIGNILQKWTGASGSQSMPAGRFGNGLKCDNNAQSVIKTIDSQAEWWVGAAFKMDAFATSTLFGVRDAGTTQLDVRISGAGLLSVTRNGTTLATGTTVLGANIFYYLELHALINSSTGAYELRINGLTEVSGSGANTQASGNATANQIFFGGSANANHWWDDIYACDASGATNNSFLGDVRIECLAPSGDGNYSQLVGSDGNSTNNSLLVDEATPNDDTDYVQSGTVNDKDTYAFGNMTSTTGTVYGVQPVMWAKKTNAGARSIASLARLSGTDVASSDFALTTGYTYTRDVRETKPGGGSWTITDVNNAEFGVKVTV